MATYPVLPCLPCRHFVSLALIATNSVWLAISMPPSRAEARTGAEDRMLNSPYGAPHGEYSDRSDDVVPRTYRSAPLGVPPRTVHGADPTQGAVVFGPGSRAQSLPSLVTGDTLSFGYVDGDGMAVLGDVWSFDHGGPDPLEGWVGIDRTAQWGTFGRQISRWSWEADPYNETPPPVLVGSGSAWIGAFGAEARALCYASGLGYGNGWGQRIVSPAYAHDGVSEVSLAWTHFNDTELDFDYTCVYLELPSGDRMELRRYSGGVGLAPDHPAGPPVGATDGLVLGPADFQGESEFRIVFEMTSDVGWSDEDGSFDTAYGPCGFDAVEVSGFGPDGAGTASYGFESDLEGWSAEPVPGIGTFLGAASSGDYAFENICSCEISGNVLEMHDGNREHPYGQRTYAVSPPVDVLNDVQLSGSGDLAIFADWIEYLDLPLPNGVFVRPGWQYFPWTCEVTGEVGWSPRMGGVDVFAWTQEPGCYPSRSYATSGDDAVPQSLEQIRFVYELLATTDFGIPPHELTGVTNASPLLDDVRIRFARVPSAPTIAVGTGLHFQDGFVPSSSNDPSRRGRADVSRTVAGSADTATLVLGDSLAVSGPLATDVANGWEAKLWFRVDRVGLGATGYNGHLYTDWRDRVNAAAGVDIEAGEFAEASMDSAEAGSVPYTHRFCSYLKEEDWTAWGRSASGPELSDEVEIIQDGVLFPGTKIEYFLTANYVNNQNVRFVLPDTSGGFFCDFEILPNWQAREVPSAAYPCLLYVDAFNGGAQPLLEAAFESLGFVIDRYDYLDANSNWKAPMARTSYLSRQGVSILQLIGYRGILVNTGSSGPMQLMTRPDYTLFSDWLSAQVGDAAWTRHGLLLNGDGIGEALDTQAPTFSVRMGTIFVHDDYAEYSGHESFCVRIEAPMDLSSVFETSNSIGDYEYDASGSGCSEQFRFDVLGTTSTGTGNRAYVGPDGLTETSFAQIANERIGPWTEGYRTILDGVSWHHLVTPDGQSGERCGSDRENAVDAMLNEIAAAMEWVYEVDYSQFATACLDTWDLIDIVDGTAAGAATRLRPSRPNPFSPRTMVRFDLATSGPATIAIYDVAGRRVRTLADGTLEAGSHELSWDGTDDAGHPLASSVYWVRLETPSHKSSSRLVRLK